MGSGVAVFDCMVLSVLKSTWWGSGDGSLKFSRYCPSCVAGSFDLASSQHAAIQWSVPPKWQAALLTRWGT